MALRGVKPTKIEKRLKAMFYGPAGVGKTMTAIQFPRPYLIDTERGAENAQYVSALEKAGGVYFPCTDPDDLIREVTALLSEKHPYQTVIIDPLTVIYDRLIEKGINEKGDKFTRALAWATRFEEGRGFLIRGGWCDEFIAECCAFTGSGKEKDNRIDAVSIAVQRQEKRSGRAFAF